MDPKQNRPRGREKNVTSGGSGARRRGEGLGTGKVGSKDYENRKPSGGGGMKRAGGIGGGSLLLILAFILLPKLLGGGSGSTGNSGSGGMGDLLGGLLGGGSSSSSSSSSGGAGDILGALLGGMDTGSAPAGFDFSTGDTSTGGYTASSDVAVNNSVASGSRAKRTNIIGNNQDTVTLMVYMCGTDLESKYGMASSDMQEMASAKYGDNVNIIVYTGGCSQWKIQGISNQKNQIYQIKGGQLKQLEADMGNGAMTNPDNLSTFIKYCAKNFPANRNELILWDHGGGSVSGYGYDEKNKASGSMNLANVSKALKAGGVKFDFIGFDACLMATAETALMLDDYADYLIASEETEPGVGWYYTNWLTKLGSNTSMPTTEIGKNIVDDFVATCATQCRGQKTTLSVIDLAEFANTVPSKLNAWAKSVSSKIAANDYQSISDARYATREFAESTRIDQVDLVNLAENTATQEGYELSKAIKDAVKYNRTSTNMTNAYGVSIYFPYKRASYVDSACNTYSQIGMDSEYSKCIRQFAKLETSGQIAAGGTGSALGSLFNLGGSGSSSSSGSADMIGSLLGAFLGGGVSGRSIAGLDSSNTSFMDESSISQSSAADYLAMNYFDASKLVWTKDGDQYKMTLPENQWSLVHSLDLNMFYDDGTGYIDLGLDNIYTFDDDGNLIADTDRNWLAINGQTVAYYHTDTTEADDKWTISGYVPALLNGERVKLDIVFDTDNPNGYIAGATPDYELSGDTDTIAKEMTEIKEGDKIDFVCDYYTYDGNYQDSYFLGDTLIVGSKMEISNSDVGDGEVRLMYCFTDIYDQEYWSEAIVK
ncbi:MAG: peptidase C11 [Ruminococcus sp.]|nr:peptidase C11 [Ruminococcus sp.]